MSPYRKFAVLILNLERPQITLKIVNESQAIHLTFFFFNLVVGWMSEGHT